MATNDLTALVDGMKDLYPQNWFQDQFKDENPFYDAIEKVDKINHRGNKAVMPLMTSMLGGGGSRGVNKALPVAQNLNLDNAEVTIMSQYHRGFMPNQTIAIAQSDAGAFVDALTLLFSSMEQAFKRRYNFNLVNTSTGKITQALAASTTSTTLTVDSTEGLYAGMAIDVHNGTSYDAQGILISSIESTTSMTLATAISATNDAAVYEAGDKDYTMNGMLDNLAVASKTVHGISKASGFWAGNVVNETVGDVTAASLIAILRAAKKEVGARQFKSENAYWMMRGEVADNIWLNILTPAQQKADVLKLDGGYETFKYAGKAVLEEEDLPEGYLHLLLTKYWKLARTGGDADYIMNAGSKAHPISGYDSTEFALRCYSNLYCGRPKANPYSYGVTE